MTDRELKKLRRGELLEMLLEQSREMESLKEELKEVKSALAKRSIEIEEAGSIAEAALQLNGVFAAAESAAEQYLESLEELKIRQENFCEERIDECKREIHKKLMETKRACAEQREKTDRECEEKLKETDRQVEEKWQKISKNLELFYQTHEGLRELMAFTGKGQTENKS